MLDISNWDKKVRKRHRNGSQPGGSGVAPSKQPVSPAPATERTVPFTEPKVIRPAPDQETLRRCAWQIGEARPAQKFSPSDNHVAMAMVSPRQGFVHWNIRPEWIERISRERGAAWTNCRLLLKLFDTTAIEFNGSNAHHVQKLSIPAISGQMFFGLPRPGTTQLTEVGFELRNGEFIAAARSQFVRFAPEGASARGDHSALHVDANLKAHPVPNIWEQEAFLREQRKPKLRKALRIATFAFESAALGHGGVLANFVAQLAAGTQQAGHEVHIFVPRSEKLPEERNCDGVIYHPLDMTFSDRAVDTALEFARAAETCLSELPPFDLFHLHEWMTGLLPWLGTCPAVISLTSTETSRLNGAEPTPVSREIQKIEHDLAQVIECVLTPDWLREKVIADYGVDASHVRAFPVEGRLPNSWNCPLELAKVKMENGLHGDARVMLYVGPLEHHAGVDLLVEAMPVALQRCPNARVIMVGAGGMHNHLQRRAHETGVGHAVKLFGHVEGPLLTRLLRAADALILPSRGRVSGDDAVVELARRAGIPVVTTHGGPRHLVRHEENGIVTYDNPGSIVWAFDRILCDKAHAAKMGENGRRRENDGYSWSEVSKLYAEICAECFPELTEVKS